MTVAFSFYRIHFVLKLVMYLTAMITYTVLTVDIYSTICQVSVQFFSLSPE